MDFRECLLFELIQCDLLWPGYGGKSSENMENQADVWARVLLGNMRKGDDVDLLRRAFFEYKSTGRKFPSPVDILEIMQRMRRGRKGAEEDVELPETKADAQKWLEVWKAKRGAKK